MPLMRSLMTMRCGCSGCRRAKASRLRVRSAPRCAASRALARELLLGGAAFLAVDQIVEIADDHQQQVVEVVGETAGELAQGLHLLGMTQLVFELPLVGDVFGECKQVFGRAGLVGDRQFFRPHQALAELARIERAFVNLVRLIRRQRAFVLQLDQIGVLALRQIAHGLADQFGAVDAEQILAGTIQIDAPAGAVRPSPAAWREGSRS